MPTEFRPEAARLDCGDAARRTVRASSDCPAPRPWADDGSYPRMIGAMIGAADDTSYPEPVGSRRDRRLRTCAATALAITSRSTPRAALAALAAAAAAAACSSRARCRAGAARQRAESSRAATRSAARLRAAIDGRRNRATTAAARRRRNRCRAGRRIRAASADSMSGPCCGRDPDQFCNALRGRSQFIANSRVCGWRNTC